MHRILKQLFNGEICPNERTRISSGEYETMRNTAIKAHDAFEDKLTGELKKELDGLLYPNIQLDDAEVYSNLGKYGKQRLSYLHEQKPQQYRELLFQASWHSTVPR